MGAISRTIKSRYNTANRQLAKLHLALVKLTDIEEGILAMVAQVAINFEARMKFNIEAEEMKVERFKRQCERTQWQDLEALDFI